MPSTTQSIEKLRKRLDKDPNSPVFSQLAEEHRKEGNLDEAIRILKAGLERQPNYWTARVTLGRVYHQMGNTISAKEELEKVVRSVPDNLLANRLLGDIYTGMQMPHEALKRYRVVQMLAPGDPDLAALIQRLESQVVEPETPKLLPEVQIEPAPPEPEEAVAAETQAEDEEAAAEEELYAPTIQVQIPEFLDKTEVVPPADSQELQESPVEEPVVPPDLAAESSEITAPNIFAESVQSTELSEGAEGEEVAEPEVFFTPDTLILEPRMESLEEESLPEPAGESFDEPKDSEELSTLASLLLSTEPESQFKEVEEDDGDREMVALEHPPVDRTQPIDENGEDIAIEEADELTSETLAELYVNQGFIDKAVKVYERLLLSDPGNAEIARRLKELNPEPMGQEEQEPVYHGEEALSFVERGESVETGNSVGDIVARRDQERRRKINTLEHWLTTIRRDRD